MSASTTTSIVPQPGQVVFILSGHQADKPGRESTMAHEGLASCLGQLFTTDLISGLAHATGVYKGQEERSIIVTGRDCQRLHDLIVSLAAARNQESVLVLTCGGRGYLKFCEDGAVANIGQYHALPEGSELGHLEAYSIIDATGETFIFT